MPYALFCNSHARGSGYEVIPKVGEAFGKEIKGAFLTFPHNAAPIYHGWKAKLGSTGELFVQAETFDWQTQAAAAACVPSYSNHLSGIGFLFIKGYYQIMTLLGWQ